MKFYVIFFCLLIKRINCFFEIFPNLSCLWIYCWVLKLSYAWSTFEIWGSWSRWLPPFIYDLLMHINQYMFASFSFFNILWSIWQVNTFGIKETFKFNLPSNAFSTVKFLHLFFLLYKCSIIIWVPSSIYGVMIQPIKE